MTEVQGSFNTNHLFLLESPMPRPSPKAYPSMHMNTTTFLGRLRGPLSIVVLASVILLHTLDEKS